MMMIKSIANNKVVLKNNQEIILFKVEPINFKLKSLSEQNTILEAYRYFLKQCDFDIQIFIETQRADIGKHIQEIKKCILYEEDIQDMANDYIHFIHEIAEVRGSISRKFFVAVKVSNNKKDYVIDKVKEGLTSCGNMVDVCSTEELNKIFQICFRTFFSHRFYSFHQSEQESFYPESFDTTHPNYIVLDDCYIGNMMVINYEKEMEAAFLDKLLSLEIDLQLSMFYEKQQSSEMIKKITYFIGNTGSELKNTGENQEDHEIMSESYANAKYIRKQLQIGGDDIYYLYIYISVCSNSEEGLKADMEKIQGIASGIGLQMRKAIFRQKEIFESCLPIFQNRWNVKKFIRRNVLTSGLVSTYPFLSNELCDEEGVLIGVNEFNKSMVMIDRFDLEKYKNPNMCIIGTSGSGKSYFTKLMVIRNRYMNISQYIIDPEREYIKMCEKLKGTLIRFESGNIVNVMEIRESIKFEGPGFLQNKIAKLNIFFSLIFPEMTSEEKSLLEEKIILCYQKKNITFDDESLYVENANQKASLLSKQRFKKSTDMPILSDLYKIISQEKRLSRLCLLMKPFVSGSMKFLNGYTNVDLSNQLIVADIYGTPEEHIPGVMYIVTELFWDNMRVSRGQKKIIYLDEVWRLISNNEETAKFVLKIFKTIRKYGGAATAITQDIHDFFVLEDGKYGRGILNNSSVKSIFQLEENDLRVLKENLNLSEEEAYRIQNMKRGTSLLYAGSNHIVVDIKASQKEHEIISTERRDN